MTANTHALRLAARQVSRDRLVTTMIFALLVHGLFLFGVGFAALAPRHATGPSADVTLVRTVSVRPPDRPRYFAQANERGPGNTRRAAASAAPRANINPFPNPNAELARDFALNLPGSAASLVPTSLEADHSLRNRVVATIAPARLVASGETPLPADTRPLLLARFLNGARTTGPLADSPLVLPQTLAGAHPEAKAKTADTRASVFAPYLEAWRERIETIGTAQFVRLVPQSIRTGHLTLAISLNSDGSIRSVDIEQRSRYPELDAAALKIIRLAAPFPPFSPAMKQAGNVLHFAYRWNFIRGGVATGKLGLAGG